MDLDKARELFGIPQTASFDEVLKAKKKLTDMKELDGDAASTVSEKSTFFSFSIVGNHS